MPDFLVRALRASDTDNLPQFLALAMREDNAADVLSHPDWAHYVSDWGRIGDVGVVAVDANRQIIGMAWARLGNADHCGQGFVDELTPEMLLAVSPDVRGQGVGMALASSFKCRLRALKLLARWDARAQKMVPLHQRVEVAQPDMEISPAFVSLCVPLAEAPRAFLEKAGFAPIEGSQKPDRAGIYSQIWRASLHEGGNWRSGTMDRSVNVNWAGAPDDFVSIDFYYNLKFSLFDDADWERFFALMRALPGRDGGELGLNPVDEDNDWAYFGPSPVKAAIHWSHLFATRRGGDLSVMGDLKWDEWCAWDEAFSWAARGLPHGLQQDESPELRELRSALQLNEERLVSDREENRKMRLRLRQLGDRSFG